MLFSFSCYRKSYASLVGSSPTRSNSLFQIGLNNLATRKSYASWPAAVGLSPTSWPSKIHPHFGQFGGSRRTTPNMSKMDPRSDIQIGGSRRTPTILDISNRGQPTHAHDLGYGRRKSPTPNIQFGGSRRTTQICPDPRWRKSPTYFGQFGGSRRTTQNLQICPRLDTR